MTVVTPIAPTGGAQGVATNSEVSQVSLYQGSTLIDTVSGTDLGNNGEAVFDDFDKIFIASNDTETFSVEVDFVDGIDAVNGSDYNVILTAATVDDDENDDISVATQIGTSPTYLVDS